jgi:hypothetical protein
MGGDAGVTKVEILWLSNNEVWEGEIEVYTKALHWPKLYLNLLELFPCNSMVWWITEAYFNVVMVVSKLRFLGKEIWSPSRNMSKLELRKKHLEIFEIQRWDFEFKKGSTCKTMLYRIFLNSFDEKKM